MKFDLYHKLTLGIFGFEFILLILNFMGIFVLGERNGLSFLAYIPLLLFLLILGMIFYGMLNALIYRWFLIIQLINCLLAWTNIYILMMDHLI